MVEIGKDFMLSHS